LFLFVTSGPSTGASGALAKWKWDRGLPGEPTIPTDLTTRAARFSDVIPSTIQNVIAVKNNEGGLLTISAGYDASGKTCFGFTGYGVGREFNCLDARIGDFAVLPYVSMGGRTLQSVDHAAVMGIARSDVSRIELTLVDGSRRKLSVNTWGAFAYLAGPGNSMPKTLEAYGADGSLLQEVNVSVGPVCGAAAGPCPLVP
jgi:hypothetical protein